MKESSLKTSTQGNMQGEPLFVFHGWAMNSSVWSVIKAELERDYLVTTVDLPGHGNNKNVVIGVFNILMSVKTANMPGNEFLLVVNTQSLRIDF